MKLATLIRVAKETKGKKPVAIRENVRLYCLDAFARHASLPVELKDAMMTAKSKKAAKRLLKTAIGGVIQ